MLSKLIRGCNLCDTFPSFTENAVKTLRESILHGHQSLNEVSLDINLVAVTKRAYTHQVALVSKGLLTELEGPCSWPQGGASFLLLLREQLEQMYTQWCFINLASLRQCQQPPRYPDCPETIDAVALHAYIGDLFAHGLMPTSSLKVYLRTLLENADSPECFTYAYILLVRSYAPYPWRFSLVAESGFLMECLNLITRQTLFVIRRRNCEEKERLVDLLQRMHLGQSVNIPRSATCGCDLGLTPPRLYRAKKALPPRMDNLENVISLPYINQTLHLEIHVSNTQTLFIDNILAPSTKEFPLMDLELPSFKDLGLDYFNL